jgi:hypothetical protein
MYPAAGAGTGAGPVKEISPVSSNRRVAKTAVKPTTKKPINSVIDPFRNSTFGVEYKCTDLGRHVNKMNGIAEHVRLVCGHMHG